MGQTDHSVFSSAEHIRHRPSPKRQLEALFRVNRGDEDMYGTSGRSGTMPRVQWDTPVEVRLYHISMKHPAKLFTVTPDMAAHQDLRGTRLDDKVGVQIGGKTFGAQVIRILRSDQPTRRRVPTLPTDLSTYH